MKLVYLVCHTKTDDELDLADRLPFANPRFPSSIQTSMYQVPLGAGPRKGEDGRDGLSLLNRPAVPGSWEMSQGEPGR